MRDESKELLRRLNDKNDVPILSVEEQAFAPYGRVVTGYDASPLMDYMEAHTDIPAEGNVYVPGVPEMEALPIAEAFAALLYGGMPIQIGYCNGRNSTFNGFEYHKGSELNVAVTDFMLALGHRWEIRDGHYDNRDAQVFFVERGTIIEMYGTTLHLSPLRVTDAGFKAVVVLPRGTNTPLSAEEKSLAGGGDAEEKLLLQRNKWVIAHPQREPLIRQGAYPGIIGENKELYY